METAVVAAIIAATASITTVAMTIIGTFHNRKKTEEAAEQNRIANEQLAKHLKKIDESQQSNLANLKSDLDKITFVVNANHSKRVEVLSQAYSKLAEIRLLLEIYIVPKFEGEGAGDSQNIKLAIEKFHELYKFCLMNGIFFSDESKIMKALGEIMGHINAMRNTMSPGNYSSWEKQARIFTNGVTPIIAEIRVEVREELKLDIKRAV